VRPVTDIISADAVSYAREHTTAVTGSLVEIASWTDQNTPIPLMMSGLAEVRLLEALIVAGGARRVLEVGTFTGFGAVAMAAALAPGGTVTTLEVDEELASAARQHIEASEHPERIELIVGSALETIGTLQGPYDLVYIDAHKPEYFAYYEAVLPILADRGVIVADNLFRAGRSFDPEADDRGTAGIRDFARRVHADDRVHNVLLTIGDGVMLIWRAPQMNMR
jgi:caffeoyl-CoA O-methyltransferase